MKKKHLYQLLSWSTLANVAFLFEKGFNGSTTEILPESNVITTFTKHNYYNAELIP